MLLTFWEGIAVRTGSSCVSNLVVDSVTARCVNLGMKVALVPDVPTFLFLKVDAAGLESNNMDQNLGRMKLFNARRKFKSAIQTVIVADRLRKFTEGMASMSTS